MLGANGGNGEFKTFILNFLIAGGTSSFAKSLAAPIDRIKLILQNQSSALQILNGQRQEYKGFFDCLIRLPKEQGFLSFWRGNGTNLIRYIPTQALNFSFNDLFKESFIRLSKESPTQPPPLITYLSGACAGACVTFSLYPLKFCQTKLSVDMGSALKITKKGTVRVEREYKGLIDCLRKVIKSEGIFGLYNGFTLALLTATTYRALYFGLFDNLKQLHSNQSSHTNYEQIKPPVLMEFIFAQIVTTTAGILTYPFDTVGRRIMLDSGRKEELKVFKGTRSAFKIIYVNEGFHSFYKGALTNCFRGVCGALILVLYDELSHYAKSKNSSR